MDAVPVGTHASERIASIEGNGGLERTFDEARFRDVLNEFGGSLTRESERDVAAIMGVPIRTLWNWRKRLSANPS